MNTIHSVTEVLIYLRKSRQDDPGETVQEVLNKHETILQDYSKKTWGEPIPESNIYREVVSGETIADRPMIQQVMQLIELPDYKAVLVIEPQRLSRGDLEDCGRIVNAFRYTDTLAITPGKTYNLSEKFDRKFFEMELMRGNDFLEYIKEIMGRGRIAAVMRGCYLGNVAPYGWQRVKVGKDYTLEPSYEFNSLILMYKMYVYQDLGYYTIGLRLDSMGIKPRSGDNNWNPATIRDILANPVNDGKVIWNRRKSRKMLIDGEIIKSRPVAPEYICVEGLHGDHITDELHTLYLGAQEKRGKTARKKPNTKIRNPLAGLLFCSCGRAMSFRTYIRDGKERCAPRLLCDNQQNCHTRSVLYSDMIEIICCILESHIKDFEVKLNEGVDPSIMLQEQTNANLVAVLAKLIEKSERQKDLLEDGIYSKADYIKRNAKTQSEIEMVKKKIDEIKIEKPIDYNEKIEYFSKAVEMMRTASADPAALNKLLKSIIEKIEYKSTTNTARIKASNLRGGWDSNQFNIDIFLRL